MYTVLLKHFMMNWSLTLNGDVCKQMNHEYRKAWDAMFTQVLYANWKWLNWKKKKNQSLSIFELLLELAEFQAYRLHKLLHIQPNLLLQLMGKLLVFTELHINLLIAQGLVSVYHHPYILTTFPNHLSLSTHLCLNYKQAEEAVHLKIFHRNLKKMLPRDHQARRTRTRECRGSPSPSWCSGQMTTLLRKLPKQK